MEELKEHTADVLYEKYRQEKLLAMGVAQDHSVFKEVKCVLPLFVFVWSYRLSLGKTGG